MVRDEQGTFEIIVAGSPEMVEGLLRLFAEEHQPRFRVTTMNNSEFPPTLDLRVDGNDIVGRLAVIGLPGNRVLLRTSTGRYTTWEKDPGGTILSGILEEVVRRFERYGLLSRRGRFASAAMIDTAVRQLSAADTPEGYASIGNICRAAMIALGKELFDAGMLTPNEETPKEDAASTKLKTIARFHWGARSERQLGGMRKIIDGTWEMCVPFLHRQNASREEADMVVGSTSQLFDMFSLIVP